MCIQRVKDEYAYTDIQPCCGNRMLYLLNNRMLMVANANNSHKRIMLNHNL